MYSTSTYLVTHIDLGRYHRLRQRFIPDTGGMCGVDWTSTKAYCAEPGGGGPGVTAFTFPQLNAQATIQALLVHHEVSYNTPLGQNVAVAFPGVDITYDSVAHAGDTMVAGWEGTAGASFPLPPGYAEIAGSEPLMLSLAPDLSGGADVKLRYQGHEKVGSTETYTKVTLVGLRRHFNRAVMDLLPRRLNGRALRTSRRDIAPHLTFREAKA